MFSDTNPRPVTHHPHPDPARIRAAMDRLERTPERLPTDDDEVSMSTPTVQAGECGTIACHGGWYLLACMMDPEHRGRNIYQLNALGSPERKHWITSVSRHLYYGDGAALLAEDIASDEHPMNMKDLKDWADAWPELWGNLNGRQMFCGDIAFGESNLIPLLLSEIIAHWRAVADRIEAWKREHPITLRT